MANDNSNNNQQGGQSQQQTKPQEPVRKPLRDATTYEERDHKPNGTTKK